MAHRAVTFAIAWLSCLVLFRILHALQFQTALQLIHSHHRRYLQYFDMRPITVAWGIGSLQNTENEVNLLLLLGSKS